MDQNMEYLVPIVLFITIGSIVSLVFYFRFRTRRELQHTIRLYIEKGADMTPELMTTLTEAIETRPNDLRRGIISLAIGVAFLTFGMLLGEPDARRPLTALSAFPILIGIAYTGLWFFTARRD